MTVKPNPKRLAHKESLSGVEEKVFNNPSYDKSLPIEARLRDFLGAYHIELNGVTSHTPFDLKYEGKPGVRCDEDSKQRIIEFISQAVAQAKKEERELIIEKIREVENPIEQIREQAEKQYHAAEMMKYLIITSLSVQDTRGEFKKELRKAWENPVDLPGVYVGPLVNKAVECSCHCHDSKYCFAGCIDTCIHCSKQGEEGSECKYCGKKHDDRLVCPEYRKLLQEDDNGKK